MFNYVIEKINSADFSTTPFRHIYIEELFSHEHFSAIINADEINVPPQESDSALFDDLFERGYKIVNFPGCITSKEKYIAWHSDRKKTTDTHTACEGFGVTLRLMEPQTAILIKLKDFLSSEAFNDALSRKFGVPIPDITLDNGIQKYLDGYEISPHPDNRKKALTFMVNVNPNAGSDAREHHTHFLSLKPEYQYVKTFWESNTDCETCWIPWDWCNTVSLHSKNNSITIFAPSFESLHGVKASYNHLEGQRTQLYGNQWFTRSDDLKRLEWEDLDIKNFSRNVTRKMSLKSKVAALLPQRGRSFLKKILIRDSKTVVRVRLKK